MKEFNDANNIVVKMSAMEECEMILDHLRRSGENHLDPNFLRIHAASLLQLIGEIARRQTPSVLTPYNDDIFFLFQGALPAKVHSN